MEAGKKNPTLCVFTNADLTSLVHRDMFRHQQIPQLFVVDFDICRFQGPCLVRLFV